MNVIGVDGDTDYHPARSSAATKTDTPLKELPLSITVVPAQLIRDASLLSMGDVLALRAGRDDAPG